jgi:hypothetical protein
MIGKNRASKNLIILVYRVIDVWEGNSSVLQNDEITEKRDTKRIIL